MEIRYWYLVAGILLCAMAFAASLIRRLPLSTAMLYLGIGWAASPGGFGVLVLDVHRDAHIIQQVAQAVILLSIFSSGLKMRVHIANRCWRVALRLAFASMLMTVVLIALTAVYLLGLAWGPAILIGAMLAPTDPVLASDVQVENPYHLGALRFALTSEAGLNDGSAFPMVMLGLLLMQKPHTAANLLQWFGVSLCWGTVAGLAVGFGVGALLGKLILRLRVRHRQALGLGYFLAPGIIALSYALGELAHGFGFLSVFASAVALRWVEMRRNRQEEAPELPLIAARSERQFDAATNPDTASVFLVELLLQFTDQLEQIGELVVVLVIGNLISPSTFQPRLLLVLLVLFVGIRPLSIYTGLLGSQVGRIERGMISWFGIRGAASLYYIAYIVPKGLPPAQMGTAIHIVLAAIVISIIIHGISVTPLMRWYSRRENTPMVE